MNRYNNDQSSPNILIVEDSPIQSLFLKRILEKEGYTVHTAKNGAEGLATAQDVIPNLIITDIVMPEMDGFNLCRNIKDSDLLNSIPVILLTTLNDPRDVINGLKCGADNFINKPYDEKVLLSRIKYILISRELFNREKAQMGIEIFFDGEKHLITSDRQQILNLLLSTYETAIHKNREIVSANEALQVEIMHREMAEEALKAAKEKAESATKTKSQFLANMSHEIRTPMNAVLGMLYLLKRTELSPQQHDYAHKAQIASQSLLSILNDILDFSKIEAGKLKLEQAPFSPVELLNNLAAILSVAVMDKNVKLLFNIADEIPPALLGDALRLQQVLLNLTSNAIKFTEQGEVKISVNAQSVTPDQTVLEFAVKDTGIGISPEMQESIFSDFVQAESSTTRRFGGTGLGLTISRQIVTMMGGALEVESEPGIGSTFSFTVTFASAPPDSVIGNSSVAVTGNGNRRLNGLRLLVVEDNLINQQVAQEILAYEGAAVALADSGKVAIGMLTGGALFDAVLMDIQMPDMNGYEVTHHIREELGMAQLPIIAMTANVSPEEYKRCLAEGMNDHIGKPFDVDKLIAVLQSYCGVRIEAVVETVSAAANHTVNRPGFEFDPALKRLNNKRSLFAQWARGFEKDQGKLMEQVHIGLAQGDEVNALMELHTLKGVTANLGAMALSHAAANLETAIKNSESSDGTHIKSLVQELDLQFGTACRVFLEVADEIDPLPAAAEALPALDRETLIAGVTALEVLLASGNMRAMQSYEEIRGQFGAALITQAQQLDEAMQKLDFSAALELCCMMKGEHE